MNLIDKSKKGHVVAASAGNAKDANDRGSITVQEVPGEDHDLTLTRAKLHPVFSASVTMINFDRTLNNHTTQSIVQELSKHVIDVKAGDMGRPETILISQANTLDVIFNILAQRAGANVGTNADLTEKYLRMALKAQSQCRTTLEALAEIKSPKSATFIKQANIAEQQQVNNGGNVTNGGTAGSHEKKPDQSNELITEAPHATLDPGATRKAGRTDPQMAPVGTVDRAQNGRGKSAQ